MTSQPQLLVVEFRTIKNPDINLDSLPTMNLFQDSQNNYFLATGIDEIKTAILGRIPQLGTHPHQSLLFTIQIVPGNKLEAYLDSLKSCKNRKRHAFQNYPN
jgi:hypothetical protein